jgi:hypothetical protein
MFFTLFHAYKAAGARKSLARVKRSHAQNLMGGSLLGIAVAIDDHALAWQKADRQSRKFHDAFELRLHDLLSELGALQLRNGAMLGALELTAEALDGLYGANHGEEIPYQHLTEDRQKALDAATDRVFFILHNEGEANGRNRGDQQ